MYQRDKLLRRNNIHVSGWKGEVTPYAAYKETDHTLQLTNWCVILTFPHLPVSSKTAKRHMVANPCDHKEFLIFQNFNVQIVKVICTVTKNYI